MPAQAGAPGPRWAVRERGDDLAVRVRAPRARRCRCCGPNGSSSGPSPWIEFQSKSSAIQRAPVAAIASSSCWRSASFIQRMPDPGLNPARSARAARGRFTGSPSPCRGPSVAPLAAAPRPGAGRNPHAPSTSISASEPATTIRERRCMEHSAARNACRIDTPEASVDGGGRFAGPAPAKRFDRPSRTPDDPDTSATRLRRDRRFAGRTVPPLGSADARAHVPRAVRRPRHRRRRPARRSTPRRRSSPYARAGSAAATSTSTRGTASAPTSASASVTRPWARSSRSAPPSRGSASGTRCSCPDRWGVPPAVRVAPATSSAASGTAPVATASVRCCPAARRRRSRCRAPTATWSRSPTA